ncbi:PTS mannose transporter subunit IIAB [Listeria monocytogenes]|nr:PTS mannose transporter subunit IIAB [Listeria monocytogenes]GAT41243.1 PTS mannose transporter subunit IIAB [Listeria monocytogenes]
MLSLTPAGTAVFKATFSISFFTTASSTIMIRVAFIVLVHIVATCP